MQLLALLVRPTKRGLCTPLMMTTMVAGTLKRTRWILAVIFQSCWMWTTSFLMLIGIEMLWMTWMVELAMMAYVLLMSRAFGVWELRRSYSDV